MQLFICVICVLYVRSVATQEAVSLAAKNGIIAYDCSSASANVSTYSLNKVDPCIITKQDVLTTEHTIIVLQKAERVKVNVQQCKLTIDRRMQHCGMHSHTSEVSNSYSHIVHSFSNTECKEAIQTGRLRLYNHIFISELKVNTTYKGEKIVVGQVESNNCQGGTYATSEQHWDAVLVFYKYTILLQEYETTANVESNTIKLTNGLMCTYTDQFCLDAEEGYSYWNIDSSSTCEQKDYEVIYTGLANKTIIQGDNHYNLGPLYTAHVGTNMFTIRAKEPTHVCSYPGFSTDHNRVFVVETTLKMNPFTMKVQQNSNLDLLTYFNSKIAFMEHHNKEQMISMYVHLMNEICHVEKSLLETHLILARINPSEFVSKLMKGPGYAAVIAGEVIHVIHCVPVYVTLHISDRCYQEIPVNYQNGVKYVAPVTRVIQQSGTEINCAPLLMGKFQFSNRWYTVDKELRDTSAPLMLGSSVKDDWTYASLGDVMNSGLYDETAIERMKSLIYDQSNQRTISNVVHRTISGDHPDKQTVNFGHLFEDADVKSQFKKIWMDVIYWTTIVANIASSTFGFYIIGKVIKFVVDTAVHCKILTDIYGMSWKLLACFWDSLTALLEHNHVRNIQKPKNTPHDKVPDDTKNVDSHADVSSNTNAINIEIIEPTAPIYPTLPKHKPMRKH